RRRIQSGVGGAQSRTAKNCDRSAEIVEGVVMSCQLRPLVWSAPLLVVLAFLPAAVLTATQGNPDPFGFKFNSGQDVQPIFEGWASNPDGSFAMYFGYLN